VFNPNASDMLPLRRWPLDRFVDLGRRIVVDYGSVNIVVTGAPVEEAAASALCQAIDSPRVINLAGLTTLRDVLVLYTIADVLVTNDSGPGHFASLTDIDNIVLFGPGAPSQFGPVGGRAHVLWAGLACSPCVNVYNHRFSPCTNNVCMQSIGVDQVYAEVRACLAARGLDGREEQWPRRAGMRQSGS
jgi:ADP-heptose:LPS heptosyltransferase